MPYKKISFFRASHLVTPATPPALTEEKIFFLFFLNERYTQLRSSKLEIVNIKRMISEAVEKVGNFEMSFLTAQKVCTK